MSKVEGRKISMVENRPVQDPCFRMSETFAKLNKKLTKNKVRNPGTHVLSTYHAICHASSSFAFARSKMTPWVNFINVFTSYFYAHRSRKRIKLLELTVVFAILGSSRVKAAHKMLVKLTPCYLPILLR